MSEELKPCPFCGSKQIIEGTETDNSCSIPMTIWFVKCSACETLRSSISNPYRAERRWNTRPVEKSLEAELEELRYIVKKLEAFGCDYDSECPKMLYPDFPCDGVKEFKERTGSDAEFDQYECDIEYGMYCWVDYYRWKFRQRKGKDINVPTNAPDTNVGNNEVKDE